MLPSEADGSITCIVYTSRAIGLWDEAALSGLQQRAAAHNEERGLTGRLLYLDHRFMQVLEGPSRELAPTYDAIRRDIRHTDLQQLLCSPVPARSFTGWAMDVIPSDALSPGVRTSAEALLTDSATGRDSTSAGRRALTLMRDIGAPFIKKTMHTRPQQSRSQLTVERLLDATLQIVQRDGTLPESMHVVATASGVGLKTTYRYFSSVDDMFRMIVRQRQMRKIADFRQELAVSAFGSDHELARLVSDGMVRDYLADTTIVPRIRQLVMERYHDIAFAELWSLADDMLAARRRCLLPPGDNDQRLRVAMSLAGLAGAAKMAALHDMTKLRSRYFSELMAQMIFDALRGKAGSD